MSEAVFDDLGDFVAQNAREAQGIVENAAQVAFDISLNTTKAVAKSPFKIVKYVAKQVSFKPRPRHVVMATLGAAAVGGGIVVAQTVSMPVIVAGGAVWVAAAVAALAMKNDMKNHAGSDLKSGPSPRRARARHPHTSAQRGSGIGGGLGMSLGKRKRR